VVEVEVMTMVEAEVLEVIELLDMDLLLYKVLH
jgi:hypothetical protein